MSEVSWKLPDALMALSKGTWPQALSEWRLDYIEYLEAKDSATCLCTNHPIREVCHIVNKENQHTAIVGNCCLTKFEGETALKGIHKIFDALKRIERDRSASANKSLIKYAYDHNIIGRGSYNFYNEIWWKRTLTKGQKGWKRSLNCKIVTAMKRVSQENRAQAVATRPLSEDLTKLKDRRLIEAGHTHGILNDLDREMIKSLKKQRALEDQVQLNPWLKWPWWTEPPKRDLFPTRASQILLKMQQDLSCADVLLEGSNGQVRIYRSLLLGIPFFTNRSVDQMREKQAIGVIKFTFSEITV